MKIFLMIIALVITAPVLAYDTDQDDNDFVQSLIQNKDYRCDKIDSMVVREFQGDIKAMCINDDGSSDIFTITKSGGKWKVTPND
ncbi:hypothetical protein FEI17_09270 [Kosakonia radicincitans]|uniref:hypothetical protein n=1 Tax=Kosakonia radicincitans TaxID=283686 RepID=UPI0011F04545|nr:hypothetical protein [Kosakonia radicincitans]QEM90827.1 hypothetical protein FEI17_09270 [Kosakonia radicincitans]